MIFSTLTKQEIVIWLGIGILAVFVGILIGRVFPKKKNRSPDEIDKEQVKEDILDWAKSIKEADEKLIKVYEGLGQIYREVAK